MLQQKTIKQSPLESEQKLAAQSALQRLLLRTFAEARIRNPSYSLRSFARKVQVSASALSEIMSGKRDVSAKMVHRILDRIELDPEDRLRVIKLFLDPSETKDENSEAEKKLKYHEIEVDQFRTISDWQHFAVLSILETVNCDSSAESIAARLGLRRQEVEVVIERLLRLELIARDNSSRLLPTFKQLSTSDGVANVAIRAAHSQSLEKAKHSLENDDVTLRDFRSITLAIDPKKLPAARKLIRQFQDEFSQFMETGERTEVYQILVNFFPLSNPLPYGASQPIKGEL